MDNSGLLQALKTIYAPKKVSNMPSEKGIQRSIRGLSITVFMRKFSRVSNFAILWSKVVSLFYFIFYFNKYLKYLLSIQYIIHTCDRQIKQLYVYT